MIRRSLVAGLLVVCAVSARAAQFSPGQVASTERTTRELPIYLGGSFALENPVGDIDIVGTDDTKVVFTAEKNVRAVDKASLAEGNEQTQVALGGDARLRVIRTLIPAVHSGRWTGSMRYTVRVPRTVHINVTSSGTSRIRIAGMRATVFVKSFNGLVTLDHLTGSCTVEAANSNILFIAPDRGMGDAALVSINGNIEVHAPAGTRFRWEGATIKGDLRTTFPVHGAFLGTRFRGNINGDGGPLLSTQSFNGTVVLLQNGTSVVLAKSVRPLPGGPDASGMQTVEMRPLEVLSVSGFFRYFTNLGNIIIGQIHGDANLTTGAGEVALGSVFGNCQVVSRGGPLNLGQILGVLSARTEAGDVVVQSARKGGTIITGGGTIRLLYTGGETTLHSGGGDIIVKQADGPINAETQSGDITIDIDADLKTEKITAKTAKGNVMINVPASFAADIDATVVTSDPDVNNINADFDGLQVRREQIGGKTKIRATGKINGGGDRLELYAEDGGIQISTHAGPAAQ